MELKHKPCENIAMLTFYVCGDQQKFIYFRTINSENLKCQLVLLILSTILLLKKEKYRQQLFMFVMSADAVAVVAGCLISKHVLLLQIKESICFAR